MTASMEMQPPKDPQDPNQPRKAGVDLLESTETGIPVSYADVVASRISKPHQEYLLERHGTLELDPIPSMDPADPYNWPGWKVNGVQFILYLFLGPETRYINGETDPKEPAWKREYLQLRRIDPTPFTWYEFVRPLSMFMYPCVMIPAASYAMIFLLSNVLATVEVPALLQHKFELNAEQLGLQFLGPIIGSLIGEQLGGVMSDLWMNTRAKKIQRKPQPEYRLWLSYLGYICSIVGTIVFLVCTSQAKQGHWNVAPIIGIAIGAAGNQIVTTVLITYSVDCYPKEAASVGVFITFVRQIWGFLGPFWFPDMFENVGIAESAGVCVALMVGVSVIPTLFLHFLGRKWRPEME
ncbi:hypothetical protein ATERTT37_000687 [Aspergillus terreus]